MGKWRTKRKNLQKRKKRRVFAAIHAELQANDERTPEELEQERLQYEDERQRVHQQWLSAVQKSNAAFEKQKEIVEERQRLILAIRQVRDATLGFHCDTVNANVSIMCNDRACAKQMEQAELEEDSNSSVQNEPQRKRGDAKNGALVAYSEASAAANESDLQLVTRESAPSPQFISDADAAVLLARILHRTASCATVPCTHAMSEKLMARLDFVSLRRAEEAARAGSGKGYLIFHAHSLREQGVVHLHMYVASSPPKNQRKDSGGNVDVSDSLVDFFRDVLEEIREFGTLMRMEIAQNQAPHLKGHVYVEYKSPDEAWRAWQGLRLRWYGGRQLQAELIAFTGWEAALCGAFLQSQCARGNEACNYLHVYPVPTMFAAQQQSTELATPQAQTPEQKHEDIIQYFERAKSACSSSSMSDLKQVASSVTSSSERPQNRSKERRLTRARSRSASPSKSHEHRDRRRRGYHRRSRSRSTDRTKRDRSRSRSESRHRRDRLKVRGARAGRY
ncbi:hypothetical protein FI667_g15991, partial [Globisporangium splendens]